MGQAITELEALKSRLKATWMAGDFDKIAQITSRRSIWKSWLSDEKGKTPRSTFMANYGWLASVAKPQSVLKRRRKSLSPASR